MSINMPTPILNNAKKLVVSVFAVLLSAASSAVTVTGSGSTFEINKGVGFDGVDGADREAMFVAAAQVWADILVSPVTIEIDAEFSSNMFCISNQATLGSAGPLSSYYTSGADSFGLLNNTWYPTALINAHFGSDAFVGSADITASFNADLGDPDCLSTSGWYYGVDGAAPAGFIDFYEVVLHELGHGLGILSLVNSDGTNSAGLIDIFTTFLKDQSTSKNWTAMSAAERNVSRLNDGNVVWNGAEVTALVGDLSAGVNSGNVQMYAPNPYESGSSISHFDTDLTPNELMEPEYTGGATYDHSIALLKDIGWSIVVPSNVVPVITGQSALSTNEDTGITLALTDLTVTDSDNSYPADFTMTASSGPNYTVSGLTITPTANFTGTLTIPVVVNDGTDDSDSYNLSVTVNAQNDKPVITAQSVLSLQEDGSLEIVVSDVTITDPDDSNFTLTIDPGENYTVSGNTISPTANYNGSLTVPIVVNDGDIDSDSFNLTVTVTADNDVPVITATPTVSVAEDNSVELLIGDFTISDPDDSSFTLTIGSGDNYSASGNTITPTLNYNGTLTVPVLVNDGDDDSASVDLTVTVTAENDAPVLGDYVTTSLLIGNALNETFTATDIDSVSLTFSLITDHSWMSISTDGELSGTPNGADLGAQDVTVTVTDGDKSDSVTFLFTVVDSTSADLSLEVSVNQTIFTSTETIELTVAVNNLGPAAFADGSVEFDLPSGVTVSAMAVGCDYISAQRIACDAPNLETTESFVLSLSSAQNDNVWMNFELTPGQTDPNESNNDDALAVFINDTSSTTADLNFAAVHNSSALVVVDLDNDEKNELIIAGGVSDDSLVLSFNESFTADSVMQTLTGSQAVNDVAVIDVNNDGFMDIVMARQTTSHVYLNDGFGGLANRQDLATGNTQAVVVADFTGDTFSDLVFANADGSNQLYTSVSGTHFVLRETIGDATSEDVAVVDFNRDGWLDVVVANSNDDDLVYLNNGADQSSSVFNTSAVLLGNQLHSSHVVSVADIDGDLVANEIVIGCELTSICAGVIVYQVSAGGVVTTLNTLVTDTVVSISVADINEDDLPDLQVLSSSAVIQIYEQANGEFEATSVLDHSGAQAVLFADLNGDLVTDRIIATDANMLSEAYFGDNPAAEPDDTGSSSNESETTVIVVNNGGGAGLLLPLLMLLLVWQSGMRKR